MRNINVYLITKKCNSVNGGIMINANVSVKIVTYVEKILFGILLYKSVRIENI